MTHMQRTLAALSGALLLLTGCSSVPQQLSTSAPESAEMTEPTRPAEDVTVTVAVSNQNDKALRNADFLIDKKGRVEVCFRTYDISYGAAGTLFVILPSNI